MSWPNQHLKMHIHGEVESERNEAAVVRQAKDEAEASLARLTDLHLRRRFSVWRSYSPFSNRLSEMVFSENSRGFSSGYQTGPFCPW